MFLNDAMHLCFGLIIYTPHRYPWVWDWYCIRLIDTLGFGIDTVYASSIPLGLGLIIYTPHRYAWVWN